MHRIPRIPIVDVLRGGAIVGVAFHHLVGGTLEPGRYAPLPGVPVQLLAGGYQGVTLFFLLSGFVLTLPFLTGRRPLENVYDVLRYYARRLRRLYPLYAASILGGMYLLGVDLFQVSSRAAYLIVTATYTFTKTLFYLPYNWVLWSLSLELWFSLLLPGLLWTARRIGMTALAASVLAGCMALRILGAAIDKDVLVNGLTGRLDDFVLGMLLAHWYVHRRTEKPLAGALLGVVLLYAGLFLQEQVRMGILTSGVLPLLNPLAGIGFFFIAASLLRSRERAAASRWLLPLRILGVASYSIYAWHGILIEPLDAQAGALPLLRYLAVLAAVCAASYILIEREGKDVLRLIRRLRRSAVRGEQPAMLDAPT